MQRLECQWQLFIRRTGLLHIAESSSSTRQSHDSTQLRYADVSGLLHWNHSVSSPLSTKDSGRDRANPSSPSDANGPSKLLPHESCAVVVRSSQLHSPMSSTRCDARRMVPSLHVRNSCSTSFLLLASSGGFRTPIDSPFASGCDGSLQVRYPAPWNARIGDECALPFVVKCKSDGRLRRRWTHQPFGTPMDPVRKGAGFGFNKETSKGGTRRRPDRSGAVLCGTRTKATPSMRGDLDVRIRCRGPGNNDRRGSSPTPAPSRLGDRAGIILCNERQDCPERTGIGSGYCPSMVRVPSRSLGSSTWIPLIPLLSKGDGCRSEGPPQKAHE